MTWVKSWLQVRGWKPRKPTKKRGSTPAQDSALMQRWLDKLRHMAQKQPSCGDNTWSDAWGFFSPAETKSGSVFTTLRQGARGPALRSGPPAAFKL